MLTNDDHIVRRIKWRCRRGTKELDVILAGFLNKELAALSRQEKQQFEALLALDDTQLTSLLCLDQKKSKKESKEEVNGIVNKILSAHSYKDE